MEWNKLVPELVVANYARAKTFYQQVFGFTLSFERPEDGFGYFDLQGAQVMLLQAPGDDIYALAGTEDKGRGLHFQIELASIDDLLSRLAAHDVPLLTPVSESWYRVDDIEHGQREFFVRDPDGYLYRFYDCIGERASVR